MRREDKGKGGMHDDMMEKKEWCMENPDDEWCMEMKEMKDDVPVL